MMMLQQKSHLQQMKKLFSNVPPHFLIKVTLINKRCAVINLFSHFKNLINVFSYLLFWFPFVKTYNFLRYLRALVNLDGR